MHTQWHTIDNCTQKILLKEIIKNADLLQAVITQSSLAHYISHSWYNEPVSVQVEIADTR